MSQPKLVSESNPRSRIFVMLVAVKTSAYHHKIFTDMYTGILLIVLQLTYPYYRIKVVTPQTEI